MRDSMQDAQGGRGNYSSPGRLEHPPWPGDRPRRTLPGYAGTEIQTIVAEGGIRCALLCACGEVLADETRAGVDPDDPLFDAEALGESLGWSVTPFACGWCGRAWKPREES